MCKNRVVLIEIHLQEIEYKGTQTSDSGEDRTLETHVQCGICLLYTSDAADE